MPTLADLAVHLQVEHVGGDLEVSGIAPLALAGASQLSFIANKNHLPQAAETQAGALILKPEWSDHWCGPALLSDNPYLCFAHVTHVLDNRPSLSGCVHPTAVVDPSATVAPDATVGPYAVIEANVTLGPGCMVGAGAYIGHGSSVGRGSRIYPNAVVYHDVTIGEDCIIHGNATIGADGFGFAPSDQGWVKIVQLGGVRMGDRVEIGASSTVDRGALEDTILGDNVILDDQVHIGHNVRVGDRTGMAACTGVGGSTTVGSDCTLAGMVGVGDHITIVDHVHVNGQGRVSKSLLEPGLYASGTSIQPYRDWSKNAVRFEQLATLAKRVAALEKQLSASSGEEEKSE